MPWVLRGLRQGVVTTRYPARPDGYGDRWRGSVGVVDGGSRVVSGDREELVRRCPTGALEAGPNGLTLDRGRCILCGRCAEARPDLLVMNPSPEVASLDRRTLVVPPGQEGEEALGRLRTDLTGRVRALRRSVHVRHVDAGSDGADEWEVAALTNPFYDVQRLGIFFTASPRHADILLVTGVGSAGMVGPLQRTITAMPEPRVVVAAGSDAISGGLLPTGYATSGGVGDLVPVDVWVPGSPASPFSLLHGILLALGRLPRERRG